jgi:histidyl-tRNA synthetase
MATKAKFQAVKGTRDLLPPETELWNRVEQTARNVFGTFGFGEIRPPILEEYELFQRAVGSETDIVGKEMHFLEQDFDNQEAAELGAIQEQIKFFPVSTAEPSTIDAFFAFADHFFKKYEDAVARQRIARLDLAKRQMEFIKEILADLRLIAKSLQEAGQNSMAQYLFDDKLTSCRTLISSVRFQPVEILRPEATASVCRAYIEHGMHALPQPVKLYYMGPMFRRERPQKGRYRQFYQIGAEVLETVRKEVASGEWRVASKELAKDAAVDAEVIGMVMTFFARLDMQGAQLEINSIGCRECRPKYVELLRAELQKVKDKLGPDSQRRIETNPLRVLDSKLESEQAIIAKLPRIGDHLCADCAKHYAEVKHQLELRGVAFKENWRLVRGLDYYMRTTFEITAKGLGSQNAVCGGGRYDGLVELLGGPPTKGIGFAIGEDRLILSLQEARKEVASGEWRVASGKIRCDVYIAWMGEKTLVTAIRAARELRQAGLRVELPPVEQKFGKALGQADKLGARYALILGEDEVTTGQWTLKTLADGTQGKYSEAQLLEFLEKQKAVSS